MTIEQIINEKGVHESPDDLTLRNVYPVQSGKIEKIREMTK